MSLQHEYGLTRMARYTISSRDEGLTRRKSILFRLVRDCVLRSFGENLGMRCSERGS